MLHLPPLIATMICVICIVTLFALVRNQEGGTSKALWVPLTYFLIEGSRPISIWLGLAPKLDMSDLYLEGSPADRVLLLGLLLIGLAILFVRGDVVGRLLQGNRSIVLFFTYAALSILWSDYPFITFKHWTKGITDLIMGLIVVTEADPVVAIRKILARTGFVLIPLSLLLSKYYPVLGRVHSVGGMMEYSGVTLNKNSLGLICVVYGIYFLWSFQNTYRGPRDAYQSHRLIAYGTLIVIVGWLLWMCNSMTSLSCLIIAGSVMILAIRPAFLARPSWTHLLVAAALFTTVFALFIDRDTVTVLGRNSNLTGRTEIWDGVLQVSHNPVIGVGYESFFLGPRLEKFWTYSSCRGIQEAHNGYLEVYVNLGWVGVGLFAFLMASGYRKIITAFRGCPKIYGLNLAFFVAALIYSFTEAGFRMQVPMWTIFLWSIIDASRASSFKGISSPRLRPFNDLHEFGPQADELVGVQINGDLL